VGRIGTDSTMFGSVNHPENELRVVLADDHPFFREGLRGMLEADGVVVVGEAGDGAEVVALTRELGPDLVVIDLNMPNTSGAEALRRIVAASPDIRIVVLTVSNSTDDVLEALTAGACGYLLKDMRSSDLVSGIRHAASGHAALSHDTLQALVTCISADGGPAEEHATDGPALTARELEVLRLIVGGADNAAIGRELSISRHTVKQYVTNIFKKLEVSGRVEAAVYAVRAGLA
jgi:two-component system nitrate/nitrite response regulator NarL